MKDKYRIRRLVSNDKETYNSKNEDPDLKNAWDLVIVDDKMWVSAADSGKIIQYTLDGKKLASFDMPNSESPTGLELNTAIGLIGADVLYIVTEQGKLYGFNPSLRFPIRLLKDNSATGASYKGLAKVGNLLYAADFHNKKIDVFDSLQNFDMVNLSFIDQDKKEPLPSNYSPFNIVNINKHYLFVLYAEKDPNKDEEVVGKGKGFINVYTLSGTFVRRFVSKGKLNAPWGLTIKKRHGILSVLVGNFGDGKINEYSINGQFIDTLRDRNNTELQIDGLWALSSREEFIYFASGPNDESDGLVGRINRVSSNHEVYQDTYAENE